MPDAGIQTDISTGRTARLMFADRAVWQLGLTPFPTKPAVGLKAKQGESYVHRESSIMAGCVNTISTYEQLNETHYASFCHCTLESICQKSVLGTLSHL